MNEAERNFIGSATSSTGGITLKDANPASGKNRGLNSVRALLHRLIIKGEIMNKMKIHKNMSVIFSVSLIYLAIFTSCASTNSKLIVSHYRYEFENQTYRIRSVNSEKVEECFNELIGENFMAIDFDQDRIIDRIVLGEAQLSEAQKIYEYGLQLLLSENKLKEHITDISQYIKVEPCCLYEIRSFRVKDADPFNEFILIENRNIANPHTMVGIDQNADGTLDLLIKDSTTLERIQPEYESMIKNGLKVDKMIKVNGKILVKQEKPMP